MNTHDHDPATDTVTAALLGEGPVHEALVAVDVAQAAIEGARTTFRRTRAAFADVLRDELRAYLDRDPDRDEGDVAGAFAEVIAALYWDHDDIVRVADLTAATGLSSKQLRTIAGPRAIERPCGRCGAATTVLQTSRSEVPWALCSTCRAVEAAARAVEAAAGPYAIDRAWPPDPWPRIGHDGG